MLSPWYIRETQRGPSLSITQNDALWLLNVQLEIASSEVHPCLTLFLPFHSSACTHFTLIIIRLQIQLLGLSSFHLQKYFLLFFPQENKPKAARGLNSKVDCSKWKNCQRP